MAKYVKHCEQNELDLAFYKEQYVQGAQSVKDDSTRFDDGLKTFAIGFIIGATASYVVSH